MSCGRTFLLLITGSETADGPLLLGSVLLPFLATLSELGEGHTRWDESGLLVGEMGWRWLTASALRLPRMLRPGAGRLERGVKKRPNLLGVTEGLRLSLLRLALVGDRKGLAGEEESTALSWGLEGACWKLGVAWRSMLGALDELRRARGEARVGDVLAADVGASRTREALHEQQWRGLGLHITNTMFL